MYMVLYKTRSFGVWSVVFMTRGRRVAAADTILLRGPPPPSVWVIRGTCRMIIYHYHDYRYYYYCEREYRTGFFFISFNVFGTFVGDPAKSWPPLRATRRRWAGYRARLVLYAVVVRHYYNKHLIYINTLHRRNYRFFDSGPTVNR
jgi:hypothetical protein